MSVDNCCQPWYHEIVKNDGGILAKVSKEGGYTVCANNSFSSAGIVGILSHDPCIRGENCLLRR